MDMKINKETLRRERELRAWTQSHLAEVADLSMRTVQRIERTGDASMESASALAAALDMELAVLMESPEIAVASRRRYAFWGVLGLIGSALVALGWWPAASAEQVMINLSLKAESGASTQGEMQFLNEIGTQSEIRFDQQFRLRVMAIRQDQGLLLSTEIYDFINGDYRLISTPSILIADNEPTAIYLDTRSSGRLELGFTSDF